MVLYATDWGVVVTRPVSQGEFLLEYRGTLVKSDPEGESDYVFEFEHKQTHYW